MEKKKLVRIVVAALLVLCAVLWCLYHMQGVSLESQPATETELPKPDRIRINTGASDRTFADLEKGEKNVTYDAGSEEFEALYELTAESWMKTYRKGEWKDEEWETYAMTWPSSEGSGVSAGTLMFLEYDEPILWELDKEAETLVFQVPGDGVEAPLQGEFCPQIDGEFRDLGVWAYYYTQELRALVEELKP